MKQGIIAKMNNIPLQKGRWFPTLSTPLCCHWVDSLQGVHREEALHHQQSLDAAVASGTEGARAAWRSAEERTASLCQAFAEELERMYGQLEDCYAQGLLGHVLELKIAWRRFSCSRMTMIDSKSEDD